MSLRIADISDIPPSVASAYGEIGISELFPWQYDCLTQSQAFQGANLAYNAPTSGGKTLISELILIIRHLKTHKKALFVLPYISIVMEKARCFDRIMRKADIKVRAFCSNKGDADLFRTDIAICTIEKANRIVTKAIDEGKMGEIGLIVIDELHIINENARGALLESIITKALYVGGVQIVGMSATLPNIEEIATWMQAKCFKSTFRPVPLTQFSVQNNCIHTANWEKVRALPPGKALKTLVEEATSCIIFCPTRLKTQQTAADLSKTAAKWEASEGVLEALRGLNSGKDLLMCVEKGIAYHHSGLTDEEKDVIEAGFRESRLRVIAATSTLAAGVNLPAQRVIVTHTHIAGEPLEVGQYRQMVGRAGRTGSDVAGESYLFIDSERRNRANLLINGDLPPVKSAINEVCMKRVVLEVICTGLCSTKLDILAFVKCTLYAISANYGKDVDASLIFLIENHIIEVENDCFRPTLLGRGLLACSLPPEQGLAVFLELDYASKKMFLLSDLYIIYLSCPIFTSIYPNYRFFLSFIVKNRENPHFHAILIAIGISEDYICSCEYDPPGKFTPNHLISLRKDDRNSPNYQFFIHFRFYTALILWGINSGMSDIEGKFGVDKGSVQALQRTASSYLMLVISLCKRLNWWQFEALLSGLRDRALYLDQSDLQQLLTIPSVDMDKARILAGSGLDTVGKIAKAPVQFITKLFQKYCVLNAVSAAVEVSTGSRKRFAAVFLTSKRKKLAN